MTARGEELVLCRFWITSNRGTDESALRTISVWDGDLKTWIKDSLEEWCSQFGAWNHGDNAVRYGYDILGRRVKPNPEYVLRRRLEKAVGIGLPGFVDEIVGLAKARGVVA